MGIVLKDLAYSFVATFFGNTFNLNGRRRGITKYRQQRGIPRIDGSVGHLKIGRQRGIQFRIHGDDGSEGFACCATWDLLGLRLGEGARDNASTL